MTSAGTRGLRFCMLTTFYPPWAFGGDAAFVRALSHQLAARGHRVTVVHSREAWRLLSGDAREPQAYTDDRDGDVQVVSIDAGLGPLSPLATYLSGKPLLARAALERALEPQFDVLHFHNPSLLGGPGVLGMGTAGVRLYTAHEQWLVCPMHVLWKYNRRVCERPTCWRCGVAFKRPPQLWRNTGLLERGLAKLDALIVPSATTGRLHESLAAKVRIEHIPHFVPEPPARDPTLDPAAAGVTGARSEPYFLYAGRLESIKGVAALVEDFGARPRRERLLIAGHGTQAKQVREAADAVPGVHLLGWVQGAELEALYRGALAVIVPTLGHESLPLVVLEALARGTPALARRFGVLDELAGETDAVLTYGSRDELHGALDRLAGDAALRDELGRHGRRAFAERWTPERHLDRYLGLIDELARARA